MAVAFSKNYISELSEDSPEKKFSKPPEMTRMSAIEYVIPDQNKTGVIFKTFDDFVDALDAFSHGEIAVFTSSGINGQESKEFYIETKARALDQLQTRGYFKKNMEHEGLHKNCFDTTVEGLKVDENYLLKLEYGKTDAIEEDLAKKKNAMIALQNASVHLEFHPFNRWWLMFDLKPMLEGFPIDENVLQDIAQNFAARKTMARRYLIPTTFQGESLFLSINLFANRYIRSNADKWSYAEGTKVCLSAWEHNGADIIGDVPKLQFRFSKLERDKNLSPLENYQRSHICNEFDLQLIYAARDKIQSNLEAMQKSIKNF